MESYIVSLIIFTATFALFGLGLNLQWGFTGLINFGHVAFMTVGAYTTVLLDLQGVPVPIAVLAGMAMAALLGLLIGLSTLRLREDYLAIVTIGVGEIIRLIALNEEQITRGSFGVQRYTIPFSDFNPNGLTRVGMIVVLTGIVGLALWRLGLWAWRRSRSVPNGTLLRAIGGMAVYLIVLAGLVVAVAQGSQALQAVEAVPNWLVGTGLLVALGAIAVGAANSGKLLSRYLPEWELGLSLVSTAIITGLGLWVYALAASAIYHYERNPVKTGLMWLSVILLAIVFWRLEGLVNSPWGRILKAIREDEEVPKALGKNVFWYKLQSLMLGGMIAGLAGSVYAWQLTTIYPDNFQPLTTFNAWTIVVLGGAGNNVGTLLGAAIFWLYDTLTRFYLKDYIPFDDARLGAFRVMVIGLILMVLMVWRPQGILGKKSELTLNR